MFVIGDLVTEVVALLEVLGEERSVSITQEHSQLANLELRADRGLMRIALMNVIHNALKFSPQDSEINVDFAQTEASWLDISIEDEGPDIPSEE